MKKFIFILILLCTTSIHAADVKLDWDVVPLATGYKIQMSTDLGVTWLASVDAKLVKPYVYTGVPEDKLVLFRISSYNVGKESLNDYAGAWYDHRKKLAAPSGVSVNN